MGAAKNTLMTSRCGEADRKGANKDEMRTLSSLRRHAMVVDLAAAHEEQEKDEDY